MSRNPGPLLPSTSEAAVARWHRTAVRPWQNGCTGPVSVHPCLGPSAFFAPDAHAKILSQDLQVRLLAAAEDGIHPSRLPSAAAPSSPTCPLPGHSLWPQLGF